MTGISVILFLFIAKKWFSLLMKKRYKFIRYATFYLISWLLLLGPAIVLLITENQHFGIGLVKNYYRDDILFDAPYHLVLSFVYLFFVNYLRKPFWKLGPLIIILLADFIMVKLNILTFHNGWSLFYFTQLRCLCLGLYIILEKHSLKLAVKKS